MSSEPTEAEVIERLVDATRCACGCLDTMCRRIAAGSSPRPMTLVDLLRHLRQASGSAGQMTHIQQNPAYIDLRDGLEGIAGLLARVPLHPTPMVGMVLARYGMILDRMWREAQKMAAAHAVPRAEVLASLDRRQAQVTVH